MTKTEYESDEGSGKDQLEGSWLVVEGSQSHSKGLDWREREFEVQNEFVVADLAELNEIRKRRESQWK